MLSPDERTLLVDLLAPPAPGYRLEHAVATTFTLHLTALLPVPLGLAGADLSTSTDPLSILQAIRNYAGLIDVFCQAGHVAVPAQRNDLLAFLEPIVHQVKAPRPGHLFHPKLWVLRYVHDDESERFVSSVARVTSRMTVPGTRSYASKVTAPFDRATAIALSLIFLRHCRGASR